MSRISLTRHVMPVLGLVAFAGAVASVAARPVPQLAESPPLPVPVAAFSERIAARGLVEPRSETIAVATELGGLIETVHVVAGQQVDAGAPLITLDARSWRAALDRAKADAQTARATLVEARAEVGLRQAEAARAEAEVASAEAELERARADAARYEKLVRDAHASAQQTEAARASYRKADAALAAARQAASAATSEVEVARARVASAEAGVASADAAVASAEVDLDRAVIRAPIAGEILRVEARPGEWATAGLAAEPLVRLGDTTRLHVRAEIDEADAPRLVEGTTAVASLRGAGDRAMPLRFVRVEPYVIPKRQLAGAGGERVDTRVLQVIYAIDADRPDAHVGQQVDVFIDTTGKPAGGAGESGPAISLLPAS
ncbi:MAG: HlyD family efflux transporter periplasmic adaptor subunit [Geminicoccaceae bacterium]